MAKQTRTILIDDLDASTDGVGSRRFALDGVEYEIDLADHNLARLRAALAPFIAAGRRLPKQRRSAPRRRGRTSGNAGSNQ
ncbi:histone-like nucleoid-structuring protein Lsr2 [Dactylosporangium sp. NPDC000244]|uniref:Lsr2 dimerization domain-containing protein n=1 Tax=Dactylosporangium sp. NPDC000244 TaxID=3154365 RepID=UPI0033267271